MSRQDFIFTPGIWLGEGKITFSASSEFIRFYTKWQISEEQDHMMKAIQTVEMQGVEEQVTNTFTFYDIQPKSFSVSMENHLVGKVVGKGIRDGQLIAWEFHKQADCEGFEVYEQQENGDYFLHAEYGSPEPFRTVVEGLIWLKGS
jgi:hypothetical protein